MEKVVFVMSNFEVLRYNRALMSRLGIYPHPVEPSTDFHKSPQTYYNFVFWLICIVLCSAYSITNWPNIGIILQPCLVMIANSQCWGMYFSVGMKLANVKSLHNELQQIVNEGKLVVSTANK